MKNKGLFAKSTVSVSTITTPDAHYMYLLSVQYDLLVSDLVVSVGILLLTVMWQMYLKRH